MKNIFAHIFKFIQNHPQKLVFFGVFAVYSIIAFLGNGVINTNSTDYQKIVDSLLENRAFFSPKGDFMMDYPPAYSLFLWFQHVLANAFGLSLKLVLPVFTSLCFAIAALYSYKVALELGMNTIWAVLTGFVAVANPFLFRFLFIQYSEPLYLTFFVPSIFFALRIFKGELTSKNIILLGVLLGLGWLTRPISLFIPFIVILLIVTKRGTFNNLKTAFFVFSFTILSILPWQIFTYNNSGEFHFLSSRGVYGIRDGLSLNMKEKSFRAPFNFTDDVQGFLDRFQANYYDYTSNKQILEFLWTEFKSSPTTVIHYYSIKAARAWYGTDSHNTFAERILMAAMLFWLLVYTWSLRKLEVFKKPFSAQKYLAVFLLISTLSIWFLNAITSSLGRYMLPMMVINAPIIMLAIYHAMQKPIANNNVVDH